MTRTEVATGAEYAFKQLAGVEQISGFEKFQNSGPGQIIDLWDAMGQRLAERREAGEPLALAPEGHRGDAADFLDAAAQAGDFGGLRGELGAEFILIFGDFCK